MRKSRHHLIRETLLAYEDGLTKSQICTISGIDARSLKKSLDAMPDVYIDRWEKPKRRLITPIYIAVKVPEDCPKPSKA
jgi:hypothetical protein